MFNEIGNTNNFGEDQTRHIAEQQARMRESAAIARYAHSRTGLLLRHLRRLADGFDPSGRDRSRRSS
jgi:hypothetical protein